MSKISEKLNELGYKEHNFYTNTCNNITSVYKNNDKYIEVCNGLVKRCWIAPACKFYSQKEIDELQIDFNNLNRDVDEICDFVNELSIERAWKHEKNNQTTKKDF